MQNSGLVPNLPASDQQVLNTTMQMAARSSPGLNLFFSIFSFALGVFSLMVKPIIRKNLGERTFGVLSIASSYLLMIYLSGSIIKELLNDTATTGNQVVFFSKWVLHILEVFFYPTIMVSFAVLEFINLKQKNTTSGEIHSFFRGESRYLEFLIGKQIFNIKLTDKTIRIWVEPIIVMTLGGLLFLFGDRFLSFIFLLASSSLLLEEYLFFLKRRQMILNLIDTELDAKEILALKETQKGSNQQNNSFIPEATMP